MDLLDESLFDEEFECATCGETKCECACPVCKEIECICFHSD